MKALFNLFLVGAFLLTGCELDSVDPPSSTLSGRVLYQDQPVGVRTNGVQLELWQRGYQLFTKIPVYVNQDGTYSATLFDGNYKLVRLRDSGPWVNNTDSIDVQVKGNTVVDVPVQPYYVVSNSRFEKSGNNINATCRVSRVATGRNIESVTLFVSSTQFVDTNNGAVQTEAETKLNIRNVLAGSALADLNKDLNLTYIVPGSLKGYCYARVGVKTQGVAELFYSPVQKIEF
ncbi:DUF3823 domain-containing protein [Hymenobacter crusticola]|uniref:DUF3823 domain-containing protein n=1 Tax=Hymenobacter crusticola TaxID=1770526 RepID=A0A243WE72_9BACT|nr:DUF3823 domain-containing protein [Hymenobacter crusticola]OUJ74018.1 hypothetical protein BXP70_09685 [Hymenobacter crusticola]